MEMHDFQCLTTLRYWLEMMMIMLRASVALNPILLGAEDITLTQYLGLLQEKDRSRMAFVCRSWYEATKDPSLWRTHIFYLYSNSEAPLCLQWLSWRINYIKHATIMCFGSFDSYRDKFLRALEKSDLLDLDINGTAYWWAADKGLATRSRVVARIVRLLKTQRRLVGFQMRQAMLDFRSGMSILDAIAVSSGDTIARLGLEDFFGDNILVNILTLPDKFTRSLMKFPNLNNLTINFEYITNNLLVWLSQYGKKRTIHLNLVSWLISMPIPRVSRAAWAALAKSGPDIRVYLVLQNIRNIREVIDIILLPEIPLYRLDLVGIAALGTDMVAEVIRLLHHVGTCFGQTLHGFRLWGDNEVSDEIDDTLLIVLKQMPRLVYLDLHMDLKAQLMGILCTLQQNRALNLKMLRMARSLTDFEEFAIFKQEIKTWFPVLKELKLDFHIRAESASYHSSWKEYIFIIADSFGIVDSEESANDTDHFHHKDKSCASIPASVNDDDNNNISNNNSNTTSNHSSNRIHRPKTMGMDGVGETVWMHYGNFGPYRRLFPLRRR